MSLSRDCFERATKHVKENATQIDLAWYSYWFEGMSADEFLDVLATYQFDNGGFGGLIYEFEYQGPCLLATEHAFRYLYYLEEKPSIEHPMIKKMMKYVLERYNPQIGCWSHLLEPQVNDGLHVWWWTYEDDNRAYDDFDERVKAYNPNGQAALAAFVCLFSELVPEELYKDIIQYPIQKILRYYDEKSPYRGQSATDSDYYKDEIQSPYNMKCLSQFCECLKDKPLADKLKNVLCQNPTACMELDETIWDTGCYAPPCDIVTSPNIFLYECVKDEVDKSLGTLISRQSMDGVWHLTYRLGEDEGFRKLESLYDTHVTVLNLATLRRFDRIDQ